MSQDIVADALNQIMNCKKAGKTQLELTRYSNFLIEVLKVAKKSEYLDYELDAKEKKLMVTIKEIDSCRSIKPRYFVKQEEVEKYVRRFLPSRNFGIVIVSPIFFLLSKSVSTCFNIAYLNHDVTVNDFMRQITWLASISLVFCA